MKKMFLVLTLASLGWAGSAQADTVLLQDNFNDAPNAGQANFNNNLATTQTGSSLGSIAYSLATENGPGGQASANAWQHGNSTKTSGSMLLNGRANSGGDPVDFASLNHNFAADANSFNAPLVIEFNIWVDDPDTGGTWASVNIGNTQNVWVNDGRTKFGSLFRPSGNNGTAQFPSGSGFTYAAGDQIRLVLSDSTETASAFNSSGTSVVKIYQNGNLVSTTTGLTLAAADGYVSFQSYFAAGYIDNLKISVRNLGASISPMNPGVAVNGNETFTATATNGSGSYTYQWQQNSTNLVGQTGATLTLNNVAQAMNGYTYAVVVNDGLNNATSAVSTLTVGNPFAADWHNQIVAGNAAIYGSTLDENNGKITLTTGTGQNGSAVIKDLTPGAQVGNFSAAFDVGMAGSGCWADGYSFNFAPLPGDNGINFAESGSGTGLAVTVPTYNQGNPALNPNVIYVKWNGTTIAQGSMPTFVSSTTMNVSVDALGNFSVTFGANPAITGIIPASGWQATVKTGWRFVLSARCGGCGETCEIGNTTIIAAPATLLAVGISPLNPAVTGGANVTFTATATGGSGSYTYQWHQNGTNLVGQTGTTLTLNNVTLGMNGYTYDVMVNDGATSVTSVTSTLSILPLAVAISPLNPAVTSGSTVLLTANPVGGSGSYTYQWKQNGSVLNGQTAVTLNLASVTAGMDGNTYQVTVNDGVTSANSTLSTLTVLPWSVSGSQLINVQILGQNGEAQQVQTGAAVLGTASDTWNHIYDANGGNGWPSVSLVDSTGAASGVTETFSAGHYDNGGNSQSPALPLLSVCAYDAPTLTLTGLAHSAKYHLVVYAGFGPYPLGETVTVNGSVVGTIAANPVNTLSACSLESTVFSDNTGQLVIAAPYALSGVQLQADSSTISVTSGGASTYGGSVTFTATVTGSGGDGSTPAGTVTFFDGGVSIGTGSLSGSGLVATATFATSALTAGTHTITASYGGNTSYGPSGLSANYSQVVTPATPSIAGVTASQSISYGTASVTLSGTVSAGAGYPADGETVSVTINGSTQNATIAGGAGGFSINFPTATIPPSATAYPITYAYAGDANLNAAANNTSTALTVTGIKVPDLTYANAPGVTRIITLAEIQAAGVVSSQSSPTYSITVVSAPTAGGTVVINGANNAIKYTYPTSGSPGSDSFTYTISDGSASASGTVTITFASVAGPQLTSTLDGSQHPVMSFHGIPGYSYHIQRATTLANGGDWADVQPIALPANGDGSATWTDTSKTVPPDNVYYRLSYP